MPASSTSVVVEQEYPSALRLQSLPHHATHDAPSRHIVLTPSPCREEESLESKTDKTRQLRSADQASGKDEEEVSPYPLPSLKSRRSVSRSSDIDVASVCIPSYRATANSTSGSGPVIFEILVKPAERSDAWTVYRRFSNFVTLHLAFPSELTALLPPLPPKRWWPLHYLRPSLYPSFLEERRASLEKYLEQVVANEELRLSASFREFIGLKLGVDRSKEGRSREGRSISVVGGGEEDGLWFLRNEALREAETEAEADDEEECQGLVSFPYVTSRSIRGNLGGGGQRGLSGHGMEGQARKEWRRTWVSKTLDPRDQLWNLFKKSTASPLSESSSRRGGIFSTGMVPCSVY